jgi:S-disulfanyl-L-cysteine oxidoreductase SoxD
MDHASSSQIARYTWPVRFVACVSVLAIATGASLSSEPPRRDDPKPSQATVWSGIFTDAQAKRGDDLYQRHCSECHASDLSGATSYNPSPPLIDRPFHLGWDGKSVGALFTFVTLTMPKESPGSLKAAEYADVLAYIFKQNRFPSGAKELPSDPAALGDIAFTLRK